MHVSSDPVAAIRLGLVLVQPLGPDGLATVRTRHDLDRVLLGELIPAARTEGIGEQQVKVPNSVEGTVARQSHGTVWA